MKYYEITMANETYEVYPVIDVYEYNKRLAILLYTKQGTAFGDITVNVADGQLSGSKETHAFVDTNNGRIFDVERFLERYQLAEPTGFMVRSGYCTYPEYKFDLKKLQEVA